MAEIEAAKTPYNPNEDDPDTKLQHASSTSEENFDEKRLDIHREEQQPDPDV
jgi:hypothetical protein